MTSEQSVVLVKTSKTLKKVQMYLHARGVRDFEKEVYEVRKELRDAFSSLLKEAQ